MTSLLFVGFWSLTLRNPYSGNHPEWFSSQCDYLLKQYHYRSWWHILPFCQCIISKSCNSVKCPRSNSYVIPPVFVLRIREHQASLIVIRLLQTALVVAESLSFFVLFFFMSTKFSPEKGLSSCRWIWNGWIFFLFVCFLLFFPFLGFWPRL